MAGLDAETIAEFFALTPLFAGWDGAVIAKVVPHARPVEYAPASVIVRAGERPQGLGIVYRGRASLRFPQADGHRELVGPGDHFGEEGMLLKGALPFTVLAEEPSTVLFLPAEIFDALVDRVPGFCSVLAKGLCVRAMQPRAAARRSIAPTTEPAGIETSSSAPPPGVSKPPVSRSVPPPPGTNAPVAFVQVSDFEPSKQVVAMVPSRLIQQSQLLPLQLRGNVLTVGMVNPRNHMAIHELRRVLTSVELEVAAIALDDFTQAVLRLRLAANEARRQSGAPLGADSIVFDLSEAEREPERAARVIGEEVVQIVNRVILTGLERDVSDIHIEPDSAGVRVRFRANGVLSDWSEAVAASAHRGIVARLKVLAGLDITERRLPQDGRIGLRFGRRDVDLRVSTLPSSRGETVVLRVLESASVLRPLEHVFVEATTLAAVRRGLNRPYGALVVAGPTGSGKTTTLYAMLHERRRTRPDSNLVMVEDPVEYRLQGVTQVQVNHAVGLTFAKVLRSMLRQDPDVLMVGEVRDHETAELAVEAAMTGHLLFTSIHANDAVSVVQRLENLGCNRMHVSQALALVLVQRLARRLCPHCVRSEPAAPLLLASLVSHGLVDGRQADLTLPRPVGCEACGQSGFAGRVSVIESLQVTDEIRAAMMAGLPLSDIRRQAAEAKILISFRQYAAFLLAKGIIGPSDAMLTLAT